MRKRIERTRRQRPGGEGRTERRDPRAERDDVAAETPTDEAAAETPGRRRRDPRSAVGRGSEGPSGRRRIDRAGAAAARHGAAAAAGPGPDAPRVRIVDDPACLILAVPDLAEGRLSGHDRDLLGAARRLADGLDGAVVVLALGGGADEDLAGAGADRVMAVDDAAFATYCPEARSAAVLAAVAGLAPRHVVFADTPTGGGDVGRRVAARLGERPAANVQRLATDRVVRRGDGGDSDFLMPPPRVLLVAPEAAEPVRGIRHEARRLEPAAFEPTRRLTDDGLKEVDPNGIALAETPFIVSAGNGVTDWPAFHRLAAALGATEGGSRVVCDAGHLPRERQVGSSGTLVEPLCYLAFGIAGAPQHLQGIARCERVVAVNTDIHADMIKRADLAVIADAQAVMPALADLIEGGGDDA